MAKSYGAGTNNEWSTRTTEQKNNVKKSNLGITTKKTEDTVKPVAQQTSQPGAVVGNSAPSSSNVTVGQSPSGYQSTSNFDDYEDDNGASEYWTQYLNQMKAADAAQKAAVQAAVDQSVNSLNAQKTTTAQDYADQYRQLYLNNMNSQKNIGQQMAAQGVTGGASESTLLGLNTNYEDNLRQGKVAEQNALSTLDQAITNAQLSGSIEAANNSATNATNTANAYLTAWQQQLAADQAAAQLAASKNTENRSYAYQIANTIMQGGQMPSDELLNTAGISKADAQTIVAQYVANKIASGGYSGSSGNGGSGNGDANTSNTIYKQTNNYGMSANESTANAKGELKNDYQGVLSYLKTNINSAPIETLRNYVDKCYENDLITGTQQSGLHKYLNNNATVK